MLYALLPMVIVNGSIVSFLDVKIFVLLILTLLCAADLVLKTRKLHLPLYFVCVYIYALLRILTVGKAQNYGLFLQSTSLIIAAGTIGVWIVNSRIDLKAVALAIIPGILLSAVCSFCMYFYRFPLLSTYSPFGAPIGLKNSLSVYLAASIPLQLLVYLELKRASAVRYVFCRIGSIVLTIVSLWIVIANRTRSAWWTLIFLCLLLVFHRIRDRKKYSDSVLGYYLICLATATLLTIYVPTLLQWRSDTPYLDSLQTLISFEASNGRVSLWRVAIDMIKDNLWCGIGTSNYPILWQSYIPNSGVDPSQFAFLRPDLHLFNDYLESFVENGILGGLAFTFLFMVLPFKYAMRKSNNLNELLLSSVGFIISIDAFFDYPFNRPESLLLLICGTALFLRDRAVGNIKVNPRILYIFFISIFIFSSLCIVRIGPALYYRRAFVKSNNVSDLKSAWYFWPWDFQWDAWKIRYLLSKNEITLAKEIAEKRKQYWPNDPQSYLMLDLVRQKLGNVNDMTPRPMGSDN